MARERNSENDTMTIIADNNNRLDFGKSEYGCQHYRRRCRIRAPCCDEIFSCRHCHNATMSAASKPEDRHELVRQDVTHVVCAICDTEQQVAHVCITCGVKMGEYFCEICKFYDDDISKEQFHCDDCGICRVGGRDKYFHCKKCASCYGVALLDNHSCIENSMKNHCPICYEYLFDSIQSARIMKCGHTIHMDCFEEMIRKKQYRCPMCFKSVFDMASAWERMDEEIAATAMPPEYHYEVEILCNDCNSRSKAPFHIVGHKCVSCNSYNTRIVGGNVPPQPQSDQSS